MLEKTIHTSLHRIQFTARTLTHLVRILREALYLWPINNLRAVVGNLRDLWRPSSSYSELHMLQIRSLRSIWRLISYVLEALLLPFGLKRKLESIHNMEPWLDGPATFVLPGMPGYEDESWYFVNGVANDDDLALMSGRYICDLFKRPLVIVANPTGALIPDLIEVTIQKGFPYLTETGKRLLGILKQDLTAPTKKRIVLLAHSQGAVIVARVLEALKDLRPTLLKKLEIYTFGNPADTMQILSNSRGRSNKSIPYLEHFANKDDLVARLGVLASRAQARGDIHIDGSVFQCNRFGHFLNEHYLNGIELRLYRDAKGQALPRLYGYLNGARPVA